jgi:hypothetical protein
MAEKLGVSGKAKGGLARARVLGPSRRSEIAATAAKARWEEALPKSVASDRPIKISDVEVPCYVLDDGRRVITANGMLDTLQMARGGAMVKGMNRFEFFVTRRRIKPYVSNDLHERVKNPIKFKVGKAIAYGFESDTLIEIAEAVIRADNAGTLQTQQAAIAHQCRVITSSLTRIGLIALIDEATGYQTKRDNDELQQILTAYLLPEHRPWMQTIPQEFTNEIYRVYGWKRTADNRGPRYAGKLIRQLIYERLPKPVLPALDEMNPTNAKYQRKRRHHQFLTEQQGLDHFRTLTITVMTLLRISKNKNDFKRHVRDYFGSQLEMDFGEESVT